MKNSFNGFALRFYTTVGQSGLIFKEYEQAVRYLKSEASTYWYRAWITDEKGSILYEERRPYMVLRGVRMVCCGTGEVFYSPISFSDREEAEKYAASQPQFTKIVELRDSCDYLDIPFIWN